MRRALDLLEQITDVLVAQAFSQLQLPGSHLERFRGPQFPPGVQSTPKVFIDYLFHGLAGTAHLGLQLGSNVVIDC